MVVQIGGYEPGLQFRLNIGDADPYIVSGGGESTETETYSDRQRDVITTTPATHGSQYNVDVVIERGVQFGEEPVVTLSSSDELIATLTDGQTVYQDEGDFYVQGVSAATSYYPEITKKEYLTNAETSEPSVITYGPWVPVVGSVREDAEDAVDDRIAISTTKNIFTTQDHSTPTYVRNASCWASDLDLTCISPWNSTNANRMAGTLISPRHIVFATHYQIGTGATVRFVDADNNVTDKTMTAKQNMPGYSPYYPDITIGLLDSDVPGDISFAKILPSDWADYIPGTYGNTIPALCLDQEEKALVTDVSSLNGPMCSFRVPTDATRLLLYESKIGGDSGNPAFLIIDDELVIVTVWTYGGAGSGTSIHDQKTNINNAMTNLGGGYQLTEIDLSGFTDFGS